MKQNFFVVIASEAWKSHILVIARNKVTWQSHKKFFFNVLKRLLCCLVMTKIGDCYARNDNFIFSMAV